MVALCDRSSSTLARVLSLSSRLTPPTRSAAFSRSANQRAASLDAPRCDITNTDAPEALALLKASAWIETRSEEHTSELQSLMRISYAVFCLKKKTETTHKHHTT